MDRLLGQDATSDIGERVPRLMSNVRIEQNWLVTSRTRYE